MTMSHDNEIKTEAPKGAIKPAWIRLPQIGCADPHTGLKRSKLNELILASPVNGNKPPVKSICLRNRGQKKGVRLISYDSLMDYLNGLLSQQEVAQ
jgi:hypothetical protein